MGLALDKGQTSEIDEQRCCEALKRKPAEGEGRPPWASEGL